MQDNIQSKIFTLSTFQNTLNDWRLNGKNCVFTNGVFDIVHRGHIDYLNKASQLGDKMILGLNSDASVKRLGKGDDRPINSELAFRSMKPSPCYLRGQRIPVWQSFCLSLPCSLFVSPLV